MTTLTTDVTANAAKITPRALVALFFTVRRARPAAAAAAAEDARVRRAFVMDRLADNSDAFASEQDVQAMLSCFARVF